MMGEGNGLPELPQGWVWTTLEQVAELVLGQSPPSSTYNEDGVGLPFYQGKAEFSNIYPIPRKWCSAPKKIAEKGDVLISVRAPVGPTNICPEKSCIGRGLAAIRSLGGIGSLFILYLMRAFENVIAGKGTGTTFKAIRGNQLRGFLVPLPPLAEQRRIVAKIEALFTQLDAGVAALEKARAQLRRYRQAVLKAAVEGELTREWREAHRGELEPASVLLERAKEERKKQAKRKPKELSPADVSDLPELPGAWVWARLGEVAVFRNGINFKGNQKGEKGILTVDVLSMYSKGVYVDLGSLYRVDTRPKDDLLLKRGDILFVRSSVKREGVGWAAAFKEIDEPVTFCGFIIRARLQSKEISPEYLTYYLRTHSARREIVCSASQVVITNINQDSVAKIVFPLPPFDEQKEIIAEVERRLSVADEMEKAVQQSQRQAERLRQSVLKQAFEGKLVPQEPGDEPASALLARIQAEKARREAEKKARKRSRKKKSAPQLELL